MSHPEGPASPQPQPKSIFPSQSHVPSAIPEPSHIPHSSTTAEPPHVPAQSSTAVPSHSPAQSYKPLAQSLPPSSPMEILRVNCSGATTLPSTISDTKS